MAIQEDRPIRVPDVLERRAWPRHVVDCAAVIVPVSGAARLPGRLIELSLGGCRVATDQRFLAGILVRVEVQFQLQGIVFRIVGVTVGSRDARSIAIRFLDMTRRRSEELAEVIAEVAQGNGQTVSPHSVQAEPGAGPLSIQAPRPAAKPESTHPPHRQVPSLPNTSPASEPVPAPPSPIQVKPSLLQDRRSSGRHAVDTSARLLLVTTAISMPGRILNLSLGGCRIRTEERFNVGIYVRVEAEFYLHGLPFRVGGVSQAILDQNTIGIRFLDLSERRREQLAELIAEIAEAASSHAQPGEVALAQDIENARADR